MTMLLSRRSALLDLLGSALALAIGGSLSFAADAALKGRCRLTRRELVEDNGSWRLMMTLHLGAPPHVAQVDLRLVFRLKTKQRSDVVIEEKCTVDFADAAGKIDREARAELTLLRERGFGPGTWSLQVLGPDGPLCASSELVLASGDRSAPSGEGQ